MCGDRECRGTARRTSPCACARCSVASQPSLHRRFEESLRRGCERGEFRVCQFSIQRDHVHLLVEAAGKEALARGMKSVTMRLVRAASRVFGRRGPVLYGRYHLRVLRTPREVRNALAYVLLNVRKHWQRARGAPPPVRLDVASSGGSFDGWRRPAADRRAEGAGFGRAGSDLAADHRLAASRALGSGGGSGRRSVNESAGSRALFDPNDFYGSAGLMR